MASKMNLPLILLALACCVAYVLSEPLLGGLNDEKPADETVNKIVKEIKPEIEKSTSTSYSQLEVVSYRTQVVAGANYFIKVAATAKDGTKSHIHLRVYKPFRGGLELTAVRPNQDQNQPLKYFA